MASTYPTLPQIEECLSEILVSSVDTGNLSEADQWLWTLLKAASLNQPIPEQSFMVNTEHPEPALLVGLLLSQQNWPDRPAVQTLCVRAEKALIRWLQQQLTGPCPDWVSATCLLTFQYLALSKTDADRLAEMLEILQDRYLFNGWDSGSDLTLESGTTGWLLMLLRIRQAAKESVRIQMIVRDIDAHLAAYITYLHGHQIPIDSPSDSETLFPTSVGEDEWRVAENQSWSQGDLGHLLLLYQAETVLHQRQLGEWAHRMGGYLIHLRQMGRMALPNAGLMTGTAGVSLLYRRLYQLTGQERYLEEGIHWLHETIRALQQPDRPADYSFRTGTLGVACAFKHWLGHNPGIELLHV